MHYKCHPETLHVLQDMLFNYIWTHQSIAICTVSAVQLHSVKHERFFRYISENLLMNVDENIRTMIVTAHFNFVMLSFSWIPMITPSILLCPVHTPAWGHEL